MLNMIGKLISSINYLISSIDRRTATNIKHTFYLLVFILLVFAVISGYRLGKQNAKIKSKPLSEITNDIFSIDMKKEKKDGDFTNMLESEMINEIPDTGLQKEEFPTQENLKPNLDEGIIDTTTDKKIRTTPPMDDRNLLIDENFNSIDSKKSDVRSLDEIDNKKEMQPIRENNKSKIKSKTTEVKELETKEDTELSPIKKDEGLFEN